MEAVALQVISYFFINWVADGLTLAVGGNEAVCRSCNGLLTKHASGKNDEEDGDLDEREAFLHIVHKRVSWIQLLWWNGKLEEWRRVNYFLSANGLPFITKLLHRGNNTPQHSRR